MSDWMNAMDDVPVSTGSPMPVADYAMKVIDAKEVQTKAGDGTMVVLELAVQGGDFDGRKLKTRFNVVSKSPEAQEIGRKQWASFCRSAGFITPKQAAKEDKKDKALLDAGLLTIKHPVTMEDVTGKTIMVRTKMEKNKDTGAEFAAYHYSSVLNPAELGDEVKEAAGLMI